jgi:hypothetical protein
MIKVKGQISEGADYEQKLVASLHPFESVRALIAGDLPMAEIHRSVVRALNEARIERASQSYDWWESL